MKKITKSINQFKDISLNEKSQSSIKGGRNKQKNLAKKMEKIQKRLERAATRNNRKHC